MFTVSNQNNVYSILNNWCICINISCGGFDAVTSRAWAAALSFHAHPYHVVDVLTVSVSISASSCGWGICSFVPASHNRSWLVAWFRGAGHGHKHVYVYIYIYTYTHICIHILCISLSLYIYIYIYKYIVMSIITIVIIGISSCLSARSAETNSLSMLRSQASSETSRFEDRIPPTGHYHYHHHYHHFHYHCCYYYYYY